MATKAPHRSKARSTTGELQSPIWGIQTGTYKRSSKGNKHTDFQVGYFKDTPFVTLTIEDRTNNTGFIENVVKVTKDGFDSDTLNNSFDADRYWVHYIAYGIINYQKLDAATKKRSSSR